ncbi:MAG: HD domain-containing protein [Spirochaetales bacterium]|jgi:exopolyphosphatase/guanosine-5'-triphosphate,3'-diphosphate pyrophosphatase|nr:HD domain-containing protein [Spirochaetales bacterium]
MNKNTSKAKLSAVIDMGASAIRIVIAEIDKNGDWKRIDRAVKPVPLGRDVFVSGYISRETSFLVIQILGGFTELLAGWNIPREDVQVIATSAVREAKNRDTFIDQVFLRTGLRIHVLEGIEENHLTYLAVEHAVRDLKADMARSNSLIIEVGAGSTDIMLLHRGKVLTAHTLRLGAIRMERYIDPDSGNYSQIEDSIRDIIRDTQDILDAEFRPGRRGETSLSRIKYFVAVGRSARTAAEKAGTKVKAHYSLIDKKDFLDFVSRIQKCTVDECVRMLQITYYEAEGLIPSLIICKHFLEQTQAGKLLVPDAGLREGVFLSFALDTTVVEKRFFSQVITSAVSLGRKYHFEEEHALHVAKIALAIFDQLTAEHGLDAQARLLLETSAILHDIGNYIEPLHHDRHGQYIIAHSQIFGFSQNDIKNISFVVRFHRGLSPHASPRGFASLPREERLRVLKITAILRLADSLDRGHTRKIPAVRLEKTQDEILLHADYEGEPFAERKGILLKSRMFEEVFGYRVRLV